MNTTFRHIHLGCQYNDFANAQAFGTPLVIELPEALPTGAEVEIGVFFASTVACTGGQFLEPAMTRGKQHPFFFTQFQAIHARSIVPCQVGCTLYIHKHTPQTPSTPAYTSQTFNTSIH